jgi:tetraacyldisaccharide 4'-kinase
MAARLPGVPIVVDADRVRGGAQALRLGADVVLLDDGFQHLRLARDLDVVLVDAGDPWGGGQLPPKGRLREPLGALQRASVVLVTKLPAGVTDPPTRIVQVVERHAPGVPLRCSRMVMHRVWTPDGHRPPEALAGERVFAFAGLGRPEGFRDVLETAGAEVVGQRWFPDHHAYTAVELDLLLGEARRHEARAVTTGKDAVKLPENAEVWVAEVEVEPVAGSWDEVLDLCAGVGRP